MYSCRNIKRLRLSGILLLAISLFVLLHFLLPDLDEIDPYTPTHQKAPSSLRDWLNNPANIIQQDDPLLIQFVRQNHIFPANKYPYHLDNQNDNPSYGQLQSILPLLRKDSGGFFVEAGANDGEWGSNTMYLEKQLGWNGLLVEASPLTFDKLLTKNRKAWHSNAALSTISKPMMATFYENPEFSVWGGLSYRFYHKNTKQVQVQCIPLYTLLLAINRTEVDFLSLDLEGSELEVLRTTPFDKVNIKAIAVEVINGKEGPEPVKEFMASNGYHMHDTYGDVNNVEDIIFINQELFQLKQRRG